MKLSYSTDRPCSNCKFKNNLLKSSWDYGKDYLYQLDADFLPGMEPGASKDSTAAVFMTIDFPHSDLCIGRQSYR